MYQKKLYKQTVFARWNRTATIEKHLRSSIPPFHSYITGVEISMFWSMEEKKQSQKRKTEKMAEEKNDKEATAREQQRWTSEEMRSPKAEKCNDRKRLLKRRTPQDKRQLCKRREGHRRHKNLLKTITYLQAFHLSCIFITGTSQIINITNTPHNITASKASSKTIFSKF